MVFRQSINQYLSTVYPILSSAIRPQAIPSHKLSTFIGIFFLNFQQIYDINPYATNTFNFFLIIFAIIDKIHNMQFSIVPKIDAEIMFSEDDLSVFRQSTDGLYYMIHTEKVMEVMPMTLPDDETEHPFPYDTYDTGTREFEKLLLSDEWIKMREI